MLKILIEEHVGYPTALVGPWLQDEDADDISPLQLLAGGAVDLLPEVRCVSSGLPVAL
jgi:hypothetical protein